MKRYPFLDWMRGLAVVLMIQTHTFNSFVRADLRGGGPYMLSQFVGGMAAPLFLFMAGMTFGFQMESLERREASRLRRWLMALRRAAYILAIAYLFRLTAWAGSWPNGAAGEIVKVDILNCMGLAMAALAAAAVIPSGSRVHFAAAAGLAIAAAAPLAANLNWNGAPPVVHQYLASGVAQGGGRFAFFPFASYVAFGIGAGTAVRRAGAEIDRLMQWCAPAGLALVFSAQYLSNVPYSIYPKSNFWTDSPALVLIRTGITLLVMAGAYLWTQFCAGGGWSWVQTLGKASLLVYWVHVMLVYGSWLHPIQRALSIPSAVFATLAVMAAMVALAAARLRWKAWRARKKPPRAADLTPTGASCR